MVGLVALAIVVLVGLPLTLYLVQQQQEIRQHAANIGIRRYPCGGMIIQLFPTETPACDVSVNNGTVAGLKSFQANYIMDIVSGTNSPADFKLHYKWADFWCPVENPGPCEQNIVQKDQTVPFNSSGRAIASSDNLSPLPPFSGLACGYYQYDFGFEILGPQGVVCGYGNLTDLAHNNASASWCHSGLTCSTSKPTPSPTRPPTLPPTAPPTPTPTIPTTPTPTIVVSPTPTVPLTGTPTPTPSVPVTPTVSPTPSPSIVVTTTPTTPPPVSTPTPTPPLPPTGPGNVFVSVGIVGVAVTLLGGLMLGF